MTDQQISAIFDTVPDDSPVDINAKRQAVMNTTSTQKVEAWLYCDGGHPGHEALAAALVEKTREWLKWKNDGMDIVASAVRDELCDIVNSMDD